jgi:hypothetical protein
MPPSVGRQRLRTTPTTAVPKARSLRSRDVEFPGLAAGQGPHCGRERRWRGLPGGRATIMIVASSGQIRPTSGHDHETAPSRGLFPPLNGIFAYAAAVHSANDNYSLGAALRRRRRSCTSSRVAPLPTRGASPPRRITMVGSLRGLPVVDENSRPVEQARLEVLQRLLCS